MCGRCYPTILTILPSTLAKHEVAIADIIEIPDLVSDLTIRSGEDFDQKYRDADDTGRHDPEALE